MRVKHLLAAGLVLLPSLAMAAEPATGGGMPQLDFRNPLTTSQVVWMVIIFAVFYVLLRGWALPQVERVLETRAASIAGDLEVAQQAKSEADAAVGELTAATRQAHADAQAQIAAAVDAAKQQAAAQARELNEQLERQLQEAEARIAEARTAAMGALRQVATDTAGFVVARLTGQQPDRPALDAAVGQALAQRQPAAVA